MAKYYQDKYLEVYREWLPLAEQDSAEHQFRIGAFYDNGLGVSKDHVEGFKWFRKAAEQGHVQAQGMLGLLYSIGSGVPKDMVQAYMWINLAAAKGNEHSIEDLRIAVEYMTESQIEKAKRLTRKWRVNHNQ